MGQSVYKADAPAASYMDVTTLFALRPACTMLPDMRARAVSATGAPRRQAAQRSPSASRTSRRAASRAPSNTPPSLEPPADREAQAPGPRSLRKSQLQQSVGCCSGYSQTDPRAPRAHRCRKRHPVERPIDLIRVVEREGTLRRNEEVVHHDIVAARAAQSTDVPCIHNLVRSFWRIRHSHFRHARRHHLWLARVGNDHAQQRDPVR